MRAISTLRRDDGISTRACRPIVALRIRDSMSEIGSVIFLGSQLSVLSFLPATLRDAGDVSLECELAEAQTAERELAHVRARAPAAVAAIAQPDPELRRL